MGQKQYITTKDDHKLGVYVVKTTMPAKGSVIIIQEVFGVNQHIRNVCQGYADAGFVALAPALFDRVEPGVDLAYDQESIQKGVEIRKQLTWDMVLNDVEATIELARSLIPTPPAIVGYCFGGSVAWNAATQFSGLSAAIGYYGSEISKMSEKTPKCPVMLHFGSKDKHITASDIDIIRNNQPDVIIHMYDADHGFNCTDRMSYDADSAKLAFERTINFMNSKL